MRHLSKTIIAVFLAVLMGTLLPVQVFAQTPDYIGEVKVYAGDYSAAQAEGYTLLTDGENPVDLNQGAGGGIGSKGEKAIYLGYKTTKNKEEAITDLALMNMKGGYSVQEYEALMEKQLLSQIIPFVEKFLTAVKEYRTNYTSSNAANQQKAQYVHDALNKLTDDDTGKALGDLLLNPTKQELGDKYETLNKEQKAEHADLNTIIAQANGQATLMLESLITRAADTNEDTWLDRFAEINYNTLEESTGLPPTDAAKKLAKLYDDDAQQFLDMWNAFKNQLDNYEETLATLEAEQKKDYTEQAAFLENYDPQAASDEEIERYGEYSTAINHHTETIANCEADIFCHDYLESIDYEDGTMLDFFTRDYEEAADEIELLYPLVASLSAGQRAGLEFVTLQDLVMIGATDIEGYKSAKFDEMESVSIYLGVDRQIYQKGGVALTSDVLRQKAVDEQTPEQSVALHILAGVFAAFAITSVGVLAYSASVRNTTLKAITQYNKTISNIKDTIKTHNLSIRGMHVHWEGRIGYQTADEFLDQYGAVITKHKNAVEEATNALSKAENPEYLARLEARSSSCSKMMVGAAVFTVVMVGLSALMVYLDYQQMKEYYKVDFTPIPHYMVEEKDIIGYNKKGEKIMLKNQSAYYKAVDCNRNENDEMYKNLGTCADMNGDVGKQWLALYSVKKELMEPILASSLKAVVGSTDIPAGYETGIHMFGTEAAFNLNSSLYDWNNSAPSVYVYYKTDDTTVSTTGSTFTAGTLALTGGAGIAVGAVITALAMKAKRKPEQTVSATV